LNASEWDAASNREGALMQAFRTLNELDLSLIGLSEDETPLTDLESRA
jgi:hypothetical protein